MTHILYRFYDARDELLYVGVTNNPARRFEKHRGDKSWWGTVANIKLEQHASRDLLLAAERDAIETEKPVHNIRMNGNGHGNGTPRSAKAKLPKSLQRKEAYAFGMADGTCPVGVVIDGDEDGVVITLFDWLVCMFSGDDVWLDADEIRRWCKAEHMSESAKRADGWDPDGDVRQMQPLGDFQTRWHEMHQR